MVRAWTPAATTAWDQALSTTRRLELATLWPVPMSLRSESARSADPAASGCELRPTDLPVTGIRPHKTCRSKLTEVPFPRKVQTCGRANLPTNRASRSEACRGVAQRRLVLA